MRVHVRETREGQGSFAATTAKRLTLILLCLNLVCPCTHITERTLSKSDDLSAETRRAGRRGRGQGGEKKLSTCSRAKL